MKKKFSALFGACGIFFLILLPVFSSAYALSKPFDHSLWDQFLKTYVNEKGEVNFSAAKENPELLDQYFEHVEKKLRKVSKIPWPREERIALWMNIYHAGVIKAIIDHYPVKSINDIPGIWDIHFIRFDKAQYSLNQIRKSVLLDDFKDEKIHLALYCGARDCPQLKREAFTGPRVEGQLFLAVREFVNDPARNHIIPGEKKIQLSRIFKWYAADFVLDFGEVNNDRGLPTEDYAVLSFLAHYSEDLNQISYLEQGKYKIKYFPFDWSLNEWKTA